MQRHIQFGASFIMIFLSLLYSSESDLLEKGIKLFEAKQFSEAKAIFNSIIEKESKNAAAAFHLGRILFIERELDDSVDWLEKSVEYDPNNSDYHFWLGQAYGRKAQKANIFKRAYFATKTKGEFEKAVELDSTKTDARFGLLRYYLMAPGIMGGSVEKARVQAETIRSLDVILGHRAFGIFYENEDEFDKAEQEYQTAALADSGNIQLKYQLIFFYARRKQLKKVFALLEKIIKMDSTEINAYYQFGRLAARSGESLERAVECLKIYITKKPGVDDVPLSWAHFRLGQIYVKQNRKDFAKIAFEKTLQLDPTHKGARKALDKLE